MNEGCNYGRTKILNNSNITCGVNKDDIMIIDKARTALVMIDLQKGIVSSPTLPHAADTVIAHAAQLARAFRRKNMPVFLVRVAPSHDGRDRLEPIADKKMQIGISRSPDWSEIVPELGPEEGDFIITKRQWGAFYGTELDLQLRRRNIDSIVLCGISTNVGVESTARFAYEYGYQQIFAEDACSARSVEDHEHPMKTVFPRMGRVRTCKEIIESLE